MSSGVFGDCLRGGVQSATLQGEANKAARYQERVFDHGHGGDRAAWSCQGVAAALRSGRVDRSATARNLLFCF